MTTIAIAQPAKKVRRKKNVQQVKSPVFDVLERLQRKGDLVGTTFTIHGFDRSRRVQTINKDFVLTERGTNKSIIDLLKDMNAIVHDYGSSHFTI